MWCGKPMRGNGNWLPHTQRELNPMIDVEDVSLVNMCPDNGVLAAYQQIIDESPRCEATDSLRAGGAVREVPPMEPELAASFERGRMM